MLIVVVCKCDAHAVKVHCKLLRNVKVLMHSHF